MPVGYDANDGYFNRVNYLEHYIENNRLGEEPSLTIKQALATTRQEAINLLTAYRYIKSNYLTIDEAKALTESERQILNVYDKSMQNNMIALQNYRKLFQAK